MSDSTDTTIAGMMGETPVAPARIKKAKRTRNILIVAIILLVGALGYLGYFGYTIFMEGATNGPGSISQVTTVIDGAADDPSAPEEVRIETTSIPDLASLFGLTADDVATRLAPGFTLSSVKDEADEANPAVRQLATFSFTPTVSGGAAGAASNISLPSETLYASLDENGRVIDIYYVCDLRLLGYPEQSFDDLLANAGLVSGVLTSANVQPRDFDYVAPNPEESILYDNPNSTNRKVVKQSHIFSGRTSSSELPTVWTLTVTYDFGSGAASTNDFRQATRTINLKLA
jgi:hypothetical protein